jgi:hypothetical protein
MKAEAFLRSATHSIPLNGVVLTERAQLPRSRL